MVRDIYFLKYLFIWLCQLLVEACRIFFIERYSIFQICCCMQAFSSCGERGLLFVSVHRLLIVVASLGAEHRLWGVWASVAVVLGLMSCGARA